MSLRLTAWPFFVPKTFSPYPSDLQQPAAPPFLQSWKHCSQRGASAEGCLGSFIQSFLPSEGKGEGCFGDVGSAGAQVLPLEK